MSRKLYVNVPVKSGGDALWQEYGNVGGREVFRVKGLKTACEELTTMFVNDSLYLRTTQCN